jgi:hypothetical protein
VVTGRGGLPLHNSGNASLALRAEAFSDDAAADRFLA